MLQSIIKIVVAEVTGCSEKLHRIKVLGGSRYNNASGLLSVAHVLANVRRIFPTKSKKKSKIVKNPWTELTVPDSDRCHFRPVPSCCVSSRKLE